VLDEPGFRQSAREQRDDILAAPSPSQVTRRLQLLAREQAVGAGR
jgi:hypothetical protein